MDEYQTKLTPLKDERSNLQSSLRQHTQGLGGATSSDRAMRDEMNLRAVERKIQGVQNQQRREHWFGKPDQDDQAEPVGKSPGVFSKALHLLSSPLYAVTGAFEHATGRGTGDTLGQSVRENVKEGQRTIGTHVRKSSMPGFVSAPLGFMLDVMFDPVNWATVGTAATVPRVAVGLYKGARKGKILEGLTEGATSSALNKAAFMGRFTPGGSSSKWKEGLDKLAAQHNAKYDELIDFSIDKVLRGDTFYGRNVRNVYRENFEKLGNYIETSGPAWMKSFVDNMRYSNAEWTRMATMREALMKEAGIGMDFVPMAREYVKTGDVTKFADDIAAQVNATKRAMHEAKPVAKSWADGVDVPLTAAESAQVDRLMATREGRELADRIVPIVKNMDEYADIVNNPTIARVFDAEEVSGRVIAEGLKDALSTISMDDIKKLANSGIAGETGIRWYDNTRRSIANVKWKVRVRDRERTIVNMERVLDASDSVISVFKRAKVGASPTAWTNSILGNMFMGQMTGLDNFSPYGAGRFVDAFNITMGREKGNPALIQLLQTEGMKDFMMNSQLMARTTGLRSNEAFARAAMDDVLRKVQGNPDLVPPGVTREEFIQQWAGAMTELRMNVLGREQQNLMSAMAHGRSVPIKTSGSIHNRMLQDYVAKGGDPRKFNMSPDMMPTSMVANEFLDPNMATRLFAHTERKAQEGGYIWRAVDFVFNKSAAGYERIDYVYKTKAILEASVDGVSRQNLAIMSRFVKIAPEDIIGTAMRDGQTMYRITPQKALEVANEAYLNYAAMPGFVKALRNLPFLGFPFISFMYGMTAKTGKTLVHNPAIFNKVESGLRNFGGVQGPMEKEALKSEYYQHLNEPGMYRIPGIDDNPMYLNLTNLLPYYSMNAFTPVERRYGDLWPDRILETIDRSPFMKDPFGQVTLDYFVQPYVLGISEPRSVFNQPLAPQEATAGTRALYGFRNLADSFTPGIVSAPIGAAVGLGIRDTNIPDGVLEGVPGFHGRRLSRAIQGQNPYGIVTRSEGAGSRTFRGIAGALGVPLQAPVSTTYISPEVKKRLQLIDDED